VISALSAVKALAGALRSRELKAFTAKATKIAER
jgi:hypothetical protein